MGAKQPRHAIVSIRLSGTERERLRRIAEARGSTISDVVRGYVEQEMAGPLPCGVSVGAKIVNPMGFPGIVWRTSGDTHGATLTICSSDSAAP
jgi:hypothetical protein